MERFPVITAIALPSQSNCLFTLHDQLPASAHVLQMKEGWWGKHIKWMEKFMFVCLISSQNAALA